jgi:hypothetical protein
VNESTPKNGNGRLPVVGLFIAVVGFAIFILGTSPELFGLDRSPVIGFVQIAVFLFGLAIICIGGYISLISMWNGRQRTIGADIGVRLVATGYVIAVASGLADVFGFGSQPWPQIPSFGHWQSRGVLIGEVIIAVGFLLMLSPRTAKKD